jgi:predicted regulator of Ras-like GTPase activity (Roadblock/LC7/MglB family)
MNNLLEFDEARIKSIEDILNEDLIDVGMHQTILSDTSGNIIAQFDNGKTAYDANALAVLAANNLGALGAMSKLIGEEEFPLFIVKGEKDNIHFNKVTEDLFLITLFSNELSMGFVRIKIANSIRNLQNLIIHCSRS